MKPLEDAVAKFDDASTLAPRNHDFMVGKIEKAKRANSGVVSDNANIRLASGLKRLNIILIPTTDRTAPINTTVNRKCTKGPGRFSAQAFSLAC